MGRKGFAFPKGLLRTGNGPSLRILPHPQWPLGVRGAAIAAAFLALLAVVAFGVTREVTTTGHTSSPATSRPAAGPQRPSWTRAEEAYIQALWPIHGEIERSAVRVSLGKIFYKTNEIGKVDLKTRVDVALVSYRRAEERIQALQPPPSLQWAHDEYLSAIRLFQQSAVETLKMFDDQNDEHLLVAYPLSQQGSDKIREIGAKFWEDEFPPH